MHKHSWLIVGLGNPGEQYHLTRHNIGFWLVDQLASKWGLQGFREKWAAFHSPDTRSEASLHIIKPLTYMNRSGMAVAQYVRFYKINPDHLLVVHDDLDMDTGRIKLVKGGGAGGHNGIKSIVQEVGTSDFYRLKIGIGRPGKGGIHPDFPVEKYVLGKIEDADLHLFSSRSESLQQGIELLLQGETARAMGLLNSIKQ